MDMIMVFISKEEKNCNANLVITFTEIKEPTVVGTLRHTLDSGRLRLDLTQPRFEDSEA